MLKMSFLVVAICFFSFVSSASGQQPDSKSIQVLNVLQTHKSDLNLKLRVLEKKYTLSSDQVKTVQYELNVTERELTNLYSMPLGQAISLPCDYPATLLDKISAEAKLQYMLTRITSTHPDVIEQQQLISKLNKKLEQELK